MPMRVNNIVMSIGGVMQSVWQRYEVDSDLQIAADGWRFQLSPGTYPLSSEIVPGAPVTLSIDGEAILTGFVDDVETVTNKQGRSLDLSGRDLAGQLVDCSVDVKGGGERIALNKIIQRFVAPLNIIRSQRIDADATLTRDRVNVEPGDTIWDALSHAAEANGLWPWMEPDGTLVVGGPDYSQPTVAQLVLRSSGKGNNVSEVRVSRSLRNRFSHMTVYGQAPGTYVEDGKHGVTATARDEGVKLYRPRVVVDHECSTTQLCRLRGRKLLADGRLEGNTITVLMAGHRRPDGELWKPGVRVECDFERDRISGIWFVMGRRFFKGLDGGTYTELRLKEDGVWVLDARPHNRKYRLGRNQAGKIIDVSGGAL